MKEVYGTRIESEKQDPIQIVENRLLFNPRAARYLQELINETNMRIDLSKRQKLLRFINTENGDFLFNAMVEGLARISDTREYIGGNDFAYTGLKKWKSSFIDSLPQGFDSNDKSIITEVLDQLFPTEQNSTEPVKTPGLIDKIEKSTKNLLPIFH